MRGFVDGEYQDGELRGLMFLAGKRGTGKTTEMVRLLDTCAGGFIFFDALSKHAHVIQRGVVVSQPGELKEYLRQHHGERFRVLYQPQSGDMDQHFEAVCLIVKAVGWMIFGIDEIDMLCGARFGSRRMPNQIYELVNYGRHHRVSMLATARTPMEVARGYTSQSHEMRLFQMTEASHIAYFEELIGKENAERLPRLEKFQYLLWRDDGDAAELRGGRR
jgi:hypothetical protein